MSYLHDHWSNDGVPSPSRTRRPTPAPPLKSFTGLKDRAVDGSAMLRASAAVAKRRGIDSKCFMMFLLVLSSFDSIIERKAERARGGGEKSEKREESDARVKSGRRSPFLPQGQKLWEKRELGYRRTHT